MNLHKMNMQTTKKNIQATKANTDRSEQLLRSYAFNDVDQLFKTLSATPTGLTSEQALALQETHGKNIISVGNKNTIGHRLLDSIINPFNIVLLVIALITSFTDIFLTTNPEYLTVTIILALIVISSLVAFIQGERSNTAAESLKKMISNKAHVWRNETLLEIPMDDVVPGDIVKLSAGDMIPADVRFLTTKDAFVAQSALTGESNPVEKFVDMHPDKDAPLTDIHNIGFLGSNIVSGSATAVVLAIGNETYFGSMAKSLSGNRSKNSFERGVDSVSRLLIRLMLVMVPVVFIINVITKGNWVSALLFAITVAVGLTPEMLPVIMTSTLARGAVAMSKRKVIVKSLSAIQTFGEMDILCTDKTGTLTEDKIILEKYMNLHGDDDDRVLRHAYLNSYFQTGLKNLMDLAIINRADQNHIDNLKNQYTRIDEIPFDFTRRRMSVVLQDQSGKRQLITKGAVEEIMSICSHVELDGQVQELNDETRQEALDVYDLHNTDGLRMIAVAQKNEVPDIDVFNVEDENDMVLIGFVGFLDPPKESAKTAIEALKEHGVRTVVLTGDSEGVAIKVCNKVGVSTSYCLTGKEVEAMDDPALLEAVKTCDLFAKLAPEQKRRVVAAFQKSGHTVGYMGDGINDAPPLHQADVGISVDSAVDIAKETADIILLEKDLMVLEEGVIEGRRTFGNIVKYIKMAASGNFGNMFSVLVASIFLPFLPMLPIHILVQNLLCDFAQMGIPFDRMDEEYLKAPRRWETHSIKRFLAIMGPLSSVFDILCFAVMWWIVGANSPQLAPLFHCGWFAFGTISQILVIHMIRTAKVPFLQSGASAPLYLSTFLVIGIVLVLCFTTFAAGLEMMTLPLSFAPWLLVLLVGYCLATQVFKVLYIKKYNEWL